MIKRFRKWGIRGYYWHRPEYCRLSKRCLYILGSVSISLFITAILFKILNVPPMSYVRFIAILTYSVFIFVPTGMLFTLKLVDENEKQKATK